jgi:DNA polymerase IV
MIACLAVPYFAAAVEMRDDSQLAAAPLVVGGQPWEPRPVYSFSHEAALQGVEPGMSLRLAHVLAPDSRFLPAHPPRYQTAAGEVIDVLAGFTPLVEPEHLWQPAVAPRLLPAGARSLPARYTIDLEGLPPREAIPLAREMGASIRRYTNFEPAVGLASGPFAASVAAALARPNHLRPVAPDEAASFLASRPLSFLALPPDTARRLHLLGVHTLGQLAALPLPALQSQFGPDIVPSYRLARGEEPSLLRRARPLPESLQEKLIFESGLHDRLLLQQALQQVAAVLATRLQEEGLVAGRLTLLWELEQTDEAPQCHPLPLRQPTAAAERLAAALLDLLAAQPPIAPVAALTVTAAGLAAPRGRQPGLFEPPPSPGLERLLPQMIARYRGACFYRPALDDPAHPLPECRFQLGPAL